MSTHDTIVFFFLRQTADIDHICPVIWQLANQNACKIKIILYHDFSPHQLLYRKIDLTKDFRLQFLLQYPQIEIERFLSLCNVHGHPPDNLLEIAENTIEKLFNEAKLAHQKGSVVFDWHFDDLPSLVLKNAKRKGFTTFMLPHAAGCLVERNHIISEDDLGTKLEEAPFIHPNDSKSYLDYDVFPNQLTATEACPIFPKERIPVLGSARYCETWIQKLSDFCPPLPGTDDDSNKLKIAVFPRSWRYPLNWSALGAALRLLADLDNVSIIVQHHTRENDFLNNISDNYREIVEIPGKLKIVDYNVYSGSLMRWADISLSLCTSVSFEAVVLGKPVLELEYLHTLRSYLAEEYPRLEILSHDDLLQAVTAIRSGSRQYVLTFEERVRFITEMVHAGDADVLSRYQELLVSPLPVHSDALQNK